MPNGRTTSNVFLRLLDWWRPRRELSQRELFQLRCVVAYSLFGLFVALYSLIQSANANAIGKGMLVLYALATLSLLVAARLGVSTARLAWVGIFLLGVFLSLFGLVTTAVRIDQLFWLVLLPLSARAVFPGADPDRDTPASSGGRATLYGAVAAVGLGVLVLVAQANGINFGQEPQAPSTLIKGTEHVLFVLTVVGLLWVHELTVRASLEELRLLQRLITYCAWCHDVCDDDGAWVRPDQYLARHHRVPVTHGMCPECFVKQTAVK